MSRTCVGLFLCLSIFLASPAWASDKKAAANFKQCIDGGESWANCSTALAISNGQPTRPPPNPFAGLLGKSSTVGARIWTPSAAERFQSYLTERRNRGY